MTNADMPGYTDRERHLIAPLCRYHRKSLPSARHDLLALVGIDEQRLMQMLIPILRMAVGLEASRRKRWKQRK